MRMKSTPRQLIPARERRAAKDDEMKRERSVASVQTACFSGLVEQKPARRPAAVSAARARAGEEDDGWRRGGRFPLWGFSGRPGHKFGPKVALPARPGRSCNKGPYLARLQVDLGPVLAQSAEPSPIGL